MAKQKTQTTNEANNLPTKQWQPSEAERDLVEEFEQQKKERVPAPRLKIGDVKIDDEGAKTISVLPDHPDERAWAVVFQSAFGVHDKHLANLQMNQLVCAIGGAGDETAETSNHVLSMMHEIGPRDSVEGMLASQMVAIHAAAMKIAKQFHSASFVNQQDSALNALNKLTRTFTSQMEALNRHRGKGQQKMTVEHIHVGEGGQAIVGNVQGGRGDAKR